ncbi:MAG: hypothetical protein ACI9E5_000733 [Candidatus Omnitrophota bacterium]|jgi:hypothetical protein
MLFHPLFHPQEMLYSQHITSVYKIGVIMKLYQLFIITLFVSLIHTPATYAEKSPNGADYMASIGVAHYNNGQMEVAIHEFRKALMLDPDQPVAHRYLKKLGLNKSTYTTDLTHRSETSRLARHIRYQNEKMKKLADENSYLKKEYHHAENEHQSIINENVTKQEEIRWLNNKIAKVEDEFSKIQKNQLNELYKTNLAAHTSQALDVSKPDQAVLQSKYYKSIKLAIEHEDRLMDLNHENKQLRNYIDDKYAHQNKLIAVLEDYIHLRESKIDVLKNNITDAKVSELEAELMLLAQLESLINQEEEATMQ